MDLERFTLSRKDDPIRYTAVEKLAEDILRLAKSHMEKRSWTREARLDVLNAMAWAAALTCHGGREKIPYELYNWFDDAAWEALGKIEQIAEGQANS